VEAVCGHHRLAKARARVELLMARCRPESVLRLYPAHGPSARRRGVESAVVSACTPVVM
jgi:hypothetical protein